MRVSALVGAAMAMLAQPVSAQTESTPPSSDIGYLTADQLVTKCKGTAPSDASYCFAYIAAVTDAARAYEIWLNAREFCLPKGAAQSEVRRAFLAYVSTYPADASGQAASVIINALKQTYPCD